MRKIFDILPSIIFNVAETLIIFLIGRLLKLSTEEIILIMVLFAMIRMSLGKAMHYKSPYKCLVWSALVFLSLFVVAKAGFIISIIMAIFCAYILTSKANINDVYMWKGKRSKYEALRHLISLSPNNAIILEHEEYWRKNYPIRYEIFKYFYRENMSYVKIMDIIGHSDDSIIKRECGTIYSVLEKPLDLPPIE